MFMSTITIEVKLDPAELGEQERRDLMANAQLRRKSVPELLEAIIAQKLRGFRVQLQPEGDGRKAALVA